MSFRSALLERIQIRRSAMPELVPTIDAGLDPAERNEALKSLIRESILQRRILVRGGGFSLIMTATDRRLLGAEVQFNGDQTLKFDFSQKLDDGQKEELILDFNRVLSIFCGIGVELEVTFRPTGKSAAGGGIPVELLQYCEDPVPDAEAVARDASSDTSSDGDDVLVPFVSSKTRKENAPAQPEEPRVADEDAGPASLAPFAFLDRVRSAVHNITFFSAGGEDAYAGRKGLDDFVDRATFSAVADWHAKVAPHLGDDLVLMMVPQGSAGDPVAIAINREHGGAVQFNRQKLGTVCNAAQKPLG